MIISIINNYKSIKTPLDIELPDFVLLTGKNGSGKTHFMEAMSNPQLCVVTDNGKRLEKIKFIAFNGLNPLVNTDCEFIELTKKRKEAWKQLNQQLQELKGNYQNNVSSYLNFFPATPSSAQIKSKRDSIFGYWYKRAGQDLSKLTEQFVLDNYELSSSEMFSSQFASIFKLYQIRYDDNGYLKYRNDVFGENNRVLSEEEFVQQYGPKPWELINEILCQAHLPYRVNYPKGHREEAFHLCLKDENSGIEIQVNDLSTGEKVLMSLALSIYNSIDEGARPDILLLDEPDAPLHPEFSKVLLTAIIESIVKKAGVKVIISTHSPTTVALAPEESLFIMNKMTSRPDKINKQQALNILVHDLDNIRVSIEDRRQVFVESKYDVQYYNRIFPLLNCHMPTTPQFLPPKSSMGSNCDEVSEIVNALRRYGNDLVYGIKDFDNMNHSSQFVLVLGENKRYAIDNYILDPIYVAFLLIRENIVRTNEIGLPPFTYVNLSQLQDLHIQTLIDFIITRIGLMGTKIEYFTQGGKKYYITENYCQIQGHELEDKIKQTWPQLYEKARGGDNALKNYILDTVCKDYPDFLSVDFIELFNKIV